MKVAELSRRSGTSVASIKFYLREGLLPSGVATGRNQAEYGDDHLKRLRLIRALIDVGGLSVATAREVLSAVDSPDSPHRVVGAAHATLSSTSARRNPDDPGWQAARAEVLSLIRQRGWFVPDDAPALDEAADAIAAFRSLGQDDLLMVLETYADAAALVAEKDVASVLSRRDPGDLVEAMVVGTVIGEALLNALRRLAQIDASARSPLARPVG
jgi:DNA-binding transcriptional MerR regulator